MSTRLAAPKDSPRAGHAKSALAPSSSKSTATFYPTVAAAVVAAAGPGAPLYPGGAGLLHTVYLGNAGKPAPGLTPAQQAAMRAYYDAVDNAIDGYWWYANTRGANGKPTPMRVPPSSICEKSTTSPVVVWRSAFSARLLRICRAAVGSMNRRSASALR